MKYRAYITNFEGAPVTEIIPAMFRLVTTKKQDVLFSVELSQANLVAPGLIEYSLVLEPAGFDDLTYEFHSVVFGKSSICKGHILRNHMIGGNE